MSRTTYKTSPPAFIADAQSVDQDNGRQIDWNNVPASYSGINATAYTVTVNDATAAEGDVALAVLALPVALPAGTVLDFGVHSIDSVQMLAVTTAYAAAGAVALAVQPLGHGIEDTSTATYTIQADPGSGKQILPGTIMAQLASGKIIPRAAVSGAETASCILLTGATENSRTDALTGYGTLVGGVVYENLLPDANHADIATWKGELNAVGVGHFVWRTWSDDSAS